MIRDYLDPVGGEEGATVELLQFPSEPSQLAVEVEVMKREQETALEYRRLLAQRDAAYYLELVTNGVPGADAAIMTSNFNF